MLAVLAPAASCSDGREPPERLIDGTRARVAPIAFADVAGPVLATSVRQRRAAPDRCGPAGRAERVVERVGVNGASVTMVAADGTLRACDATRSGVWCGQAFARRQPPQRLDARLSLTCREATGEPVGFAWVVAAPGASYVVAEHDGYAEAYAVTGDVPVRVTTSDVDLATASARFHLTEHANDGRLIRSGALDAQVSG